MSNPTPLPTLHAALLAAREAWQAIGPGAANDMARVDAGAAYRRARREWEAAAVEAAPGLLAEVEALRAKVADLAKELADEQIQDGVAMRLALNGALDDVVVERERADAAEAKVELLAAQAASLAQQADRDALQRQAVRDALIAGDLAGAQRAAGVVP